MSRGWEPERMKKESEQPKEMPAVAWGDWLDAGSVAPSSKPYVVTWPHGHKHLNVGEVVVMVETPRAENYLLRVSDMTLHHLQGQSDQYIHLAEVEASNSSLATARRTKKYEQYQRT